MKARKNNVVDWRAARRASSAAATHEEAIQAGRLAPLEGLLVVVSDEYLEFAGTLFTKSPLRKAMTFEGFLAVKGFARRTDGLKLRPACPETVKEKVSR